MIKKLSDRSLFTNDAFIDGKWISKEQKFDVNGEQAIHAFLFYSDVNGPTEPSTGGLMGRVADCDLQDFQRAIQSAHEAQKRFFSTTTSAARGALLRKWCDLILDNKGDCK